MSRHDPNTCPDPLGALAAILDLVADRLPACTTLLRRIVAAHEVYGPHLTALERLATEQGIAPQAPGRHSLALGRSRRLQHLLDDPASHPAQLMTCHSAEIVALQCLCAARSTEAETPGFQERLAAVADQLDRLHTLLQRAAARRDGDAAPAEAGAPDPRRCVPDPTSAPPAPSSAGPPRRALPPNG